MKPMTKRRSCGLTIMKFAHDVWSVCFGPRKKLVFVVRLEGQLTTARGPYRPTVEGLALDAVRRVDRAAR